MSVIIRNERLEQIFADHKIMSNVEAGTLGTATNVGNFTQLAFHVAVIVG